MIKREIRSQNCTNYHEKTLLNQTLNQDQWVVRPEILNPQNENQNSNKSMRNWKILILLSGKKSSTSFKIKLQKSVGSPWWKTTLAFEHSKTFSQLSSMHTMRVRSWMRSPMNWIKWVLVQLWIEIPFHLIKIRLEFENRDYDIEIIKLRNKIKLKSDFMMII